MRHSIAFRYLVPDVGRTHYQTYLPLPCAVRDERVKVQRVQDLTSDPKPRLHPPDFTALEARYAASAPGLGVGGVWPGMEAVRRGGEVSDLHVDLKQPKPQTRAVKDSELGGIFLWQHFRCWGVGLPSAFSIWGILRGTSPGLPIPP